MIEKELIESKSELEKQVIGELLNDQENLEEVFSILKYDHLRDNKYKAIYKAIENLYVQDSPIDIVTVYEELSKSDLKEIPTAAELASLTQDITSSANVVYHSRILFEDYMKRELVNKCSSIIKDVTSEKNKNKDTLELITEAGQLISNLTEDFDSKATKEKSLFQRLEDIFKDLEERKNGVKEEDALILQTLPTLNSYIGGIMPTDLIAIYGKEKSTKTTLAHEIAMDIGADQKKPIAIFTFENSQQETDWKSLSMRTGIDFNKLRNPKGFNSDSRLTDEELEKLKQDTVTKFLRTKIFICDQVINEIAIANKIRIWKKKHDLKLVVIDYLMLIESIQKFQNRREELNYLSRFFKRLAMQVKVPIILISQSNQEGERVAEAKGLERDSNYFIYVQAGVEGQNVKFKDKIYGDYNYSLNEDEYIVTLRGVRHAKGQRSFITRFVDNRYKEVDTRPSFNQVANGYEKYPI